MNNYTDLFSCKDKVAVVTGGAGLLGREIAKGLYDFGALVYVADINIDKTNEFAKEKKIQFIELDTTSEDSVKKAFEVILQKNNKIDILVNSAYPRTEDWGLKIEHIPFESWTTNVNNHLGGYFLCCQITAEKMKEAGKGSIINMASIYGVCGPDFSIYEDTEMTMPAAYSAIKGGIISFTKYLATYYASSNVRVNSISPGGVYDKQPLSFVDKYSKKTPLGRMAYPKEIVGGVIYLASDASSYITGHNLLIDGGWTAW
jgi:NAD(P)-dependent dehydrogenase (short-subunit alcohol dehydrogenase family)